MTKLIAIGMVRNEADILSAFLGYCARLFDEVLLVDHSSTDGTSEMLVEATTKMPLSIWRFSHQPKMQSLVQSALAHEAYARGADWIFPLDADEFPLIGSKEDLLALLDESTTPLRMWKWSNAYLGHQDSFTSFTAEERVLALSSSIQKLVANRSLFVESQRMITKGAHEVSPPAKSSPLGQLLHVPIRSVSRFKLKLETHLAADKVHGSGGQYQALARQLVSVPDADVPAVFQRLALGYPSLGVPTSNAAEVDFPSTPLPLFSGSRSLEETQALESIQEWKKLPSSPSKLWRVRLVDAEARLITA